MAISKLRRWIFDNNTTPFVGADKDKLSLKLNKVALIANIKEGKQITDIEAFAQRQIEQGKVVSILLYSEIKDLENEFLINRKLIKWTGEPICNTTKLLLTDDFDILYIASKDLGLTLEYIVKKIKAKIKVGPQSVDTKPYLDISIDTDHNDAKRILYETEEILNKLLKNG